MHVENLTLDYELNQFYGQILNVKKIEHMIFSIISGLKIEK